MMDRKYEIERLWNMAIPHYSKKDGSVWQNDNCPVVRGDYGELESRWKTVPRIWLNISVTS